MLELRRNANVRVAINRRFMARSPSSQHTAPHAPRGIRSGIWRFLAGGPLQNTLPGVEAVPAGKGCHPDERWNGGINKQTFARLWWGAELFRNGDDYGPVKHFFERQDFPNSTSRSFRSNSTCCPRGPCCDSRPRGTRRRQANRSRTWQDVNPTIAARSMEAATAPYRPDAGVLQE